MTSSCPSVLYQSHPATGPVRFLSPVRFLARKPSEAPVGILRRRCCSCGHIRLWTAWHVCILITGGNRAKLPSSRWRRRGRSLREVFACSRLFATTDLSQICNRVTRPAVTSGYGRLDTSAYLSCLWFTWIIRRTLRLPRAMPVRASQRPRTGIFNVFHILRDPYGARAWPARVPYDTLEDT